MSSPQGFSSLPDAAPGLLETLFLHSADGAALCDATLRLRRVNPAFAALVGRPGEHLSGCSLAEAWPGAPETLLRALRQSLETGEALTDLLVSGADEKRGWRISAFPIQYSPVQHSPTQHSSLPPGAVRAGSEAGDGPALALLLREGRGHPEAAPPVPGTEESGQARALQELTSALSGAVTGEDVQRVVLEQAVRATGAYAGTLIQALDAETMYTVGSFGYSAPIETRWMRFPADDGFAVVRAIRDNRSVFASRAELARDFPRMIALLQAPTEAIAALPMRAGEGRFGLALSFTDARQVRPGVQPFIRSLVDQCAQALYRTRLYDAERQARQRAAFLAEAGHLLAQSLDVDETLRSVTRLATEQVADWCAVYLPEDGGPGDGEGRLRLAAVAHRDEAQVALVREYLSRFPSSGDEPGTTAWVFRTGQAMFVPVLPETLLAALPEERLRYIQRLQLHSLISVPLRVRGVNIGVLSLATGSPDRTLSAADFELAQDLAQQAAFALDNAQLYGRAQHTLDRYRTLVDASRQIVWTADAAGEHVEEQPGWEALTGQTRAEYLGGGWADRIHPDDLPAAQAAWARAAATRSVYEVQQRVRVRDGTYRHFHVRAVPILNADGTLGEWTGVNTDITEQLLAERQLREREARYRALVEHAALGIVRIGLDGRLLEVNPATERMLGYTRGELLARSTADFTAPERAAAVAALLSELVEGKRGIVTMEEQALRKDGERLWVSVTASLVRGDGGKPLYLVALIEDITERRQNERERTRLARVVEESTDLVAFADLDDRLLYINAAGRRLLGLRGELPPGTTMAALIHPEDEARLRGEVWPQVRAGGHWEGETRFRHLDTGEGIDVHRSVFALTDPVTHERFGYATVSRDIRERKRIEAERAAWQATLEREVARRTAELQELNAELDAFSYSVSHDLRAPIRHVAGFAAMLRRNLERDPAKADRFLTMIEEAALRMNGMVDALLELARHARQPLRMAPVDLRDLVQSVRGDLSDGAGDPEAGEGQVDWQIGPLPVVRGDAPLLRQVLYNLLSNALKYSGREARARVTVSAERGDGEWVLHVRDNGVGFDPAQAGKLFGVFQRLHTAEEFQGTGIGLANVQRIVTRHGGRVWAESQPGEGATFSFTLPE